MSDGIESYIARSTNSMDCKPHYDCFKSHGKNDARDFDEKIDERHSDTYDYRDGEVDSELCTESDDKKNGFKIKFNRSLNSCQIKNKKKARSAF